MEREEEATEEDIDTSSMSALNNVKRANNEYMEQRKWVRDAKKEVTAAFSKIQEFTSTAETEEVEVDHHFNTEEQLKIHAQKRRLEDCGVVFCTVDISPSRDTFTQWLYYEVENKTAVQISHVKVLAPRHYLVILHSMEAKDAVLVGGPYYMQLSRTRSWKGPDADFLEVKRKGRANPEGPRRHIPEQALGEVSGENAAAGEVPSTSGNGVADTEGAMDTRIEEEEPQNESAHRSAASEEVKNAPQSAIPDLNVTPAELLSLSSEKPGKKKNKKARQREKRKEEKLCKETEKGAADQSQGIEGVEEVEEFPIEVASDSSGSEEEEGNNRLWQTDGKKSRGEKEAMEKTAGWELLGVADKSRLPPNE
ncbi:hypothetical protein R1sor_003936 [Riccia sorocarpa]|uniref:Uncharacterized protein n=1 Tax=Riccia sorocarpa TaxID=122646 RepID=A0ABD3H702_9MARC